MLTWETLEHLERIRAEKGALGPADADLLLEAARMGRMVLDSLQIMKARPKQAARLLDCTLEACGVAPRPASDPGLTPALVRFAEAAWSYETLAWRLGCPVVGHLVRLAAQCVGYIALCEGVAVVSDLPTTDDSLASLGRLERARDQAWRALREQAHASAACLGDLEILQARYQPEPAEGTR